MAASELRLARQDGGFTIEGAGAERFELINDYLGYLLDRNYSPRTVEAYAFDLLAFARWLGGERLALEAVTTDSIVRYLATCRSAPVRGRPGGNVVSIRDGRSAGFAPSTINRRLAAIAGLFGYREMLDPSARSPVPRGRAARRAARGERSGELGHLGRPRSRSRLRLRQPRRLPRALDRDELRALIGSLRTHRDRAIAGLMVFSGLRSAEVLSLGVRDVDIARGWVQVIGKGEKERITPLRHETRAILLSWLDERDGGPTDAVFPGPRGERLSRDGVRRLLERHVATARLTCTSLVAKSVSPHVLRHSCAMRLRRHGVDLATIALWLGHEDIRTTHSTYLHADLALKEKALALTAPPNTAAGRYQPDDELITFLEGL